MGTDLWVANLTTMQNINKLIVFCLSLLFGISIEANAQQINVSGQKSDAQFVFLNFHITKTNSHPDGEISLISQKVVKGTLKPLNIFVHTGSTNKYQITLKNSSGEIVSQTEFANPLEEELEYPGENGMIGRVTITKTEADFTVRMPYSPNSASIVIKKDGDTEQVLSITSQITPTKQ